MNYKKILLIVAAVAVVGISFMLLPLKVAACIVAGALFLLFLGGLCFIGIKSWSELAQKDPEKAKKLWAEAVFEIEANRYRYML